MQWNACKSSEIKNPFGCRDVFIIKTLTSWILKKMLYAAKGAKVHREEQCLLLDHLMEMKNKTK